MKNIFLLPLLAFLSCTNAQKSPVRFGLKAGLNVSTLYKTGSETKPMAGYHAGLFADLPISGKFRLQPEVVISYQGTGYDKNYGYGTYLDAIKRSEIFYVNVPILIRYETPVKGLGILAGPQFGKLLSAHEKGSWLNFTSGPQEQKAESDYLYEEYDFSLSAGIEYAFDFGMAVGARGNFGLTNISTQRSDMHNRVAQLYFAYNFL